MRERSGKLLARSVHGGVRGRLANLAGAPDVLVRSLGRQLEALGNAKVGDLATAADGVAAMAVVEAARRSAELDGAEVTVAPLAEAAA